jgi:Domain of unknown function (DUF222)/HNH endonuclease
MTTAQLSQPPSGPVRAMADAVVGDARSMSRLHRRMLERIGELDRRSAFRAEGYTSMASWVMADLSVTYPTARGYVEVGGALEQLPALSKAFGEGAVSYDQLRTLVRVATPGSDADLAAQAATWSATQTEVFVRQEETRRADAQRRRIAEINRRRKEEQARREEEERHRAGATSQPARAPERPANVAPGSTLPGGSPAESPKCAAGRTPKAGTLRLRPHRDGGYLEGWLPTEDFAAVEPVLIGLAKQMPKDPVTGQYAPLPERLARALVERITAEGGPERAGAVPTLVVHADVGLLDGSADGEAVAAVPGLGPLSADVLRRLACEAKVRLAVDRDGITLDLGRTTRVPSPALAAAVLRRDEGCRFPGCGVRRFLQIHHIVPWTEGGPTDLSNLAGHCMRDHLRLHHGGWELTGDANGELRYRSPEGQVLVSMPSPSWTEPRRRRQTDRPQR